jgi:hypothetical protein
VLDSTTVCQRNNDLSIEASARSVQGTNPNTTASYTLSYHPISRDDGARKSRL